MAKPTLYESTDASAPALTGENGSLIAFLDAVLVDGYGSKAAAGWTKLHSGTNLAVYETDRGRLLHVQDDGARIDARFARIRGATGATSAEVSDLIEAFPATGNTTFAKSPAVNSTPSNWICLATGNAVLLFVGNASTTNGFRPYHAYFAGYFPSAWPADEEAFAVAGNELPNANGSVTCFSSVGSTYSGDTAQDFRVAKNLAGTDSDILCRSLVLQKIGVTQSNWPAHNGQNSTVTFPGFGGLPLSPIWIYQHISPTLRGRVPSLLTPMVNMSTTTSGSLPATPLTVFSGDYGLGTRQLMVIPNNVRILSPPDFTTSNSVLVVDLDDDWDVF